MEGNDGLSRKEKLAIWRAQRTGTGPAAAGASAGAGGKGKSKAVDSSSIGSATGVLTERPSNCAENVVPGKKRASSYAKGERGRGAQRKPFQVRGLEVM